MSRFTHFVLYSLLGAAVYLGLLLQVVPLPVVGEEVRGQVIPAIPWWLLVSFGSYFLWQLGWGIFNFNDVPEAYQSLMVDIKTAKDFLRERGVDVD